MLTIIFAGAHGFSISNPTVCCVAVTVVTAGCVHANGMGNACVGTQHTLIDICAVRDPIPGITRITGTSYSWVLRSTGCLSSTSSISISVIGTIVNRGARAAITSVVRVASTSIRTDGVGTHCVGITLVGAQRTLIYIRASCTITRKTSVTCATDGTKRGDTLSVGIAFSNGSIIIRTQTIIDHSTSDSIAFVILVASTSETANSVGTSCVRRAIVSAKGALVNI
jgi:hypothetical protein